MKTSQLRWLLAVPGAVTHHALTHTRDEAIAAGLKIIGLQIPIPTDAKIIHGGLSSPIWLEVQGDCGIAGGVKFDVSDFDKKAADVRTNLWGAGFNGREIERMISACRTPRDLEKLIGRKPAST